MLGLLLLLLFVSLFLTNRSSNSLYIIGFLYLWMVFGWCTKPGDLEIYMERYELWDTDFYLMITEPLYTWTMALLHKLKLDYWDSVKIISFFILFALFFLINKCSHNKNFVLALILLSLYPMMITLFRFSYSSIFTFLSFYCLLYNRTKFKYLFFIVFVIVASLIHSMNLFYILFIIPYLKSYDYIKRNSIWGLVSVITLVTFFIKLMPLVLSGLELADKADQISEVTDNEDNKWIMFILSVLKALSIIVLSVFLKWYADRHHVSVNKVELSIVKFNIFGIIFIPLIWISFDFYRLYIPLAILNYCMADRFLKYKKVFLVSFLCTMNIGYWIVYRHYFERIFLGVYMNNFFFGEN